MPTFLADLKETFLCTIPVTPTHAKKEALWRMNMEQWANLIFILQVEEVPIVRQIWSLGLIYFYFIQMF